MQAIVVGTDGSPQAHATVLRAGDMAREAGARLHVVAGYVRVTTSRRERADAPPDTAHAFSERGELFEVLDEVVADLRLRGVDVETHWAEETPSRLMRRVARRENARLVVCGPELNRVNDRRRWRRRARHTLAQRVAQHATWRVHDLAAHPALAAAEQPGLPRAWTWPSALG